MPEDDAAAAGAWVPEDDAAETWVPEDDAAGAWVPMRTGTTLGVCCAGVAVGVCCASEALDPTFAGAFAFALYVACIVPIVPPPPKTLS